MSRRLNQPQPQTDPLAPGASEHPRPKVSLVRVWAPDGHSELHTPQNAAELCRRPGPKQLPWSMKAPGVEDEEDLREEIPIGPPKKSAADGTQEDMPPPPPSRLGALREEATALGVAFEVTWGVRKLTEEVAKAREIAERPF